MPIAPAGRSRRCCPVNEAVSRLTLRRAARGLLPARDSAGRRDTTCFRLEYLPLRVHASVRGPRWRRWPCTLALIIIWFTLRPHAKMAGVTVPGEVSPGRPPILTEAAPVS